MRRIVWRHFPSWLCDCYQVNTQSLARAGFYRTVSGGTECFSCGMWKYSSYWQEGHDPDAVHRKERPNCLFVNGLSDNVPISNEEQSVRYLRHRTLSPDAKVPRRKKTVQCKPVKPENEIRKPQKFHPKEDSAPQPIKENTSSDRTVFFSKSQNDFQLATASTKSSDSPKHPEYAEESARLSAFRTWGVQSPEALCKAGFYYTGD